MSFTEKLDAEGLAFFNDTTELPFSGQAVAFLNAYWEEVGDQAEFIFGCAWETIKAADMHAKGVSYVHLYEEGNTLEFNIGLFFYEQLCKNIRDGGMKGEMKEFADDKYDKSKPQIMTAIKRKTEIRDKVDVNFDNKISFLEYLLYQYKVDPKDFVTRSMKAPDEHPEIKKARLALEEVNKRIKAYEAEKMRLEEEAQLSGVKGLRAKNLLAQLDASPLKEELNRALITAEAAVRRVSKQFGGANAGSQPGDGCPSDGALWWLKKDLETKKKKYGKR